MKKRIISVMMIMALIVVSAIPVFAEETKVNKEEHKVENQVMGKITSINENHLTIDVATPKRNENKKDSSNNTNKATNKDNSNDVKNQEKDKELTYKDFAVGDYAQVVLADDGSAVAKVVIKGGLFRNRPEGQPGNKPDNNKA